MRVIPSRHEAYAIELVQGDVDWRWTAFATQMNIAEQVLSDSRGYDCSDSAEKAGRDAIEVSNERAGSNTARGKSWYFIDLWEGPKVLFDRDGGAYSDEMSACLEARAALCQLMRCEGDISKTQNLGAQVRNSSGKIVFRAVLVLEGTTIVHEDHLGRSDLG